MADQTDEILGRLWHGKSPRTLEKFKFIYEIFFIVVLVLNIFVALFDFTYLTNIPYTGVTFRDIYLEFARSQDPAGKTPDVLFYDRVKGIQPHRAVVGFLGEYDELKKRLATEQKPSPESLALMEKLIARSLIMINKRPPLSDFSLANKDGTLEEIKNRMRARFLKPGEELRLKSAKRSFREFFSADNLSPERRKLEFNFFDERIRPLLEQNYFRWIGPDGKPQDYFSRLFDLWFVLLFFWPDFLVRWFFAIRRKQYRAWYLFPVRNWPDLFTLFSPHHAAWLRLLRLATLYKRLKENGWLPGGGVMPGIIHDNAGLIAEEISGLVLVNILSQTREMIRERDTASLARILQGGLGARAEKLIEGQMEIVALEMVPAIRPRVAELVHFALQEALSSWLKTPLAPAMRLALEQVRNSVDKGLEAALSSPEGIARMREILKLSSNTLLQNSLSVANLEALREQMLYLLEELIEELETPGPAS